MSTPHLTRPVILFTLVALGGVALAAGAARADRSHRATAEVRGGAAVGAGGAGGAGEAGGAGARFLGFELGETKEALKLNYTVEAHDNGGGRASVTFTLADEGRIKPLTAVKVAVPSADKSGYYDVVATLAPFEKDGKKIYVFQLTRDLVERGEMNLVTHTMDGKQMMDWGYHRVLLGPALKAAGEKAKEPKADPAPAAPSSPAPAAQPATPRG